jgi:hypothetical protein
MSINREYPDGYVDDYEQFKKDLNVAKETELNVTQRLVKALENKGFTAEYTFNDDYKFDVKLTLYKDGIFYKSVTIEIKEDFRCYETGNVGLEFECRGKPSGISTSQADWYIYVIHIPTHSVIHRLMKTDTLKEMIKNKDYFRIVNGGGDGNSKNYLFKLQKFIDNSIDAFTFEK